MAASLYSRHASFGGFQPKGGFRSVGVCNDVGSLHET